MYMSTVHDHYRNMYTFQLSLVGEDVVTRWSCSSIAQEYLTDILYYLNDIMDFIQAKISSQINNQL